MELDISSAQNKSIPKAISAEAYQAFSQNEYYLEKWKPLIKGHSSMGGFNVGAAIFGATWCFYRKLYLAGVMLLISQILLIQIAIFASANSTELTAKACLILTLIGPHIFVGIFANKIYFLKARKIILETVNSRIPEDYFESALRDSGGISLGAALAFMSAIAVFRVISGVVTASL